MQNQLNEKSVAVVIQANKLTARLLMKALKKALAEMKKVEKGLTTPKTYKGKQTVKQLVGQGAGVTNIEITDNNIKAFESTARKYGVDFALKKDASVNPPKWLVFFKAKDADALTAAFSEFSAKAVKRAGPAKSSVLEALQKFKEIVKNRVVDKTRNKEHGGPER
jgi:hypothetical protein